MGIKHFTQYVINYEVLFSLFSDLDILQEAIIPIVVIDQDN